MKVCRIDVISHLGEDGDPGREDRELVVFVYDDTKPSEEIFQFLDDTILVAMRTHVVCPHNTGIIVEMDTLDTAPPTYIVRAASNIVRVCFNLTNVVVDLKAAMQAAGYTIQDGRGGPKVFHTLGFEAFEAAVKAEGGKLRRGPRLGEHPRVRGDTVERVVAR